MPRIKLLAFGLVAAMVAGPLKPLQASPAAPDPVTKLEARFRIYKLDDRIRGQRERVAKAESAHTLSARQGKDCMATLDGVAEKMKAEAAANGSRRTMTKEQYDAYNAALDANAEAISEEKQFFYYYGTFYDVGQGYAYAYDPYADAAAPSPKVAPDSETHPRIFELKERIRSQRQRIGQGLKDGLLSPDQAKTGAGVLDGLDAKMRADYKAGGSASMTRTQYNAYNTALDANAAVLHEQKHPYYYYAPERAAYRYWF